MAWLVLIFSGMCEAVWAAALSASDGFRKLRPTLLFVGAQVISMAGLAWAMTEISTGTAYAVWVGIGATLTVLWAAWTGIEKLTAARTVLLVVLVASIVGLKVVS